MIEFIKKYPMSILLGIIALNLFSIAGSLNTEAKLNRMKLDCAKYIGGQEIDLRKKYGLENMNTTYAQWCKNH